MDYILDVPSFEHIMLIKNAVMLWQNHSNIYINWHLPTAKEKWSTFEQEVCQQVDVMIIPHHFKHLLQTFVKLIGRQIRDFLVYLLTHIFVFKHVEMPLVKRIIPSIQWTIHGRLDTTETARILAWKLDLPITLRFDIACVFCMTDAIENLWTRYNDILMHDLVEYEPLETESNLKRIMFNFWLNYSFKIDPRRISYNSKYNMFFKAMEYGNQSQLEYFWSIMREDEKKRIQTKLVDSWEIFSLLIEKSIEDQEVNAGNGCSFPISILCFILSQMNKQQVDVLLSSDFGIDVCLCLLFDFLYVDFFTSFLNRVTSYSGFISYSYSYEAAQVFNLIKLTWHDSLKLCKVKKCLIDLLIKVPSLIKRFNYSNDLKKSIPVIFTGPCDLPDLLNIEFLLNNKYVTEIDRHIFLLGMSQEVFDGSHLNWDFLEAMINKCITNEYMVLFKKSSFFNAYKTCAAINLSVESNWPMVDRFLNFCFPKNGAIVKFKKCLAFDYFSRYPNRESFFIERFFSWCHLALSSEVQRHLVDRTEELPALQVMDFCLQENLAMIELLFKNMSVKTRRRILSKSFFEIVARKCYDVNWDFIQHVARTYISTEDEMKIFKEDCGCVAYRFCTEWPLLGEFVNFCFSKQQNPRMCIKDVMKFQLGVQVI
uniref:Uncharacterized protein n=1 Tax=Strigamia maritima TaxID=126957 RepID=T1JGV6_STRMM